MPLLKVLGHAELEVNLRVTRILDHLFKKYDPRDKEFSPKMLLFLAGQGQPSAQRWAVRAIVGRYKDGVPGAKNVFKKLYPLFPGKRQQEHLRGIDKLAEEVQQTRAKLKRHITYELDSKVLEQEELLARYVDLLIEARGK